MLNEDLFAIIAPNITIDQNIRDFLIPELEKQLCEKTWGEKYDLGLVYLTAHTLTVASRGGDVSGPVNSASVGSLSKSYGQLITDHPMGSTSFGVEFLRIRKQLVKTPYVVC